MFTSFFIIMMFLPVIILDQESVSSPSIIEMGNDSQIQQKQSDEKEEQKGKLLDENERGRRKIVKKILKKK
jgi:hypothetical protein